ncbi:LacI family DNA-binding transcriptional regulator [Citrobacter rodentium]|uniref:LacI-family transcriptional regulator n=2 Tax=Citrobacter rodentium TaxID=67825 RepID=D2TQF4_CITRI|nr:LacI family DNA-binding transcriptional regulator [Citrobacter rodentium]KIQ50391.1 LacI family transcriptional regulator [Citrobacter rodentium]QBY27487.1 LacI family transcriptional regulator [Citrobacter rodentium]UHO30603.1 LacI family DNA-binding transcriptional regulator [Citrobacter rodentium NBRC 105723 = DSM 16636]CBG87620.1 putative LacI-family transcriptional regulator [Citrobacter rodentium ICC168]HAT8012775.1 LacI family transcriptional regulator [Citrobacter rodentium NBRC 105
MQKKNKITMSDIAREAGVSQATVSLVLNNSRTIRLSDATRERVFQAAQQLGYQKMIVAHRLEGQEEIALLVSGMPGYDPFVDALSEASSTAWHHDMLLSVYDYSDDIELARLILQQLAQRHCAGVIFASPVTRIFDFSALENAVRMPVVLLNQYDPTRPLLPTFLPDDKANASQVTRHLLDQGVTRIAHIMGDEWMDASRMRLEGYQETLLAAGIAPDERLIRQTDWSLNATYRATQELMQLSEPPEAIFCASDWMTLGCYQALAAAGVRIPQDVLVCGYDDQRISHQLTPQLTSIQLAYNELGKMAVEYLCQGDDNATHCKLVGKLQARGSSQRA